MKKKIVVHLFVLFFYIDFFLNTEEDFHQASYIRIVNKYHGSTVFNNMRSPKSLIPLSGSNDAYTLQVAIDIFT